MRFAATANHDTGEVVLNITIDGRLDNVSLYWLTLDEVEALADCLRGAIDEMLGVLRADLTPDR
ncbi:MAG TPA: hypothetical protein VFT41_01520 [Gemmatimonadaceae bacterium]|nr:hypothetical protein [Gemmatimonadaceae bacterium]